MAIGEREWRVLSAMDGTRDRAGLALAAGVSEAAVEAFATQLAALGLLASDADDDAPRARPARDVPVRALPGYGFRCSGAGACCGLVDSVLFTPLEAARARAAAPEILDAGHDEARAFLPERGLDRSLLAVAMRDGACAYLDEAGRCRVYPVRPHGCRTFPRWHVDVGHEIRVAPRIACACELEPGDEPLTEARRGSGLPEALWIDALPATVRVGEATRSAADALAWTDALAWGRDDVLAHAMTHADALGAAPHDRAATRARLDRALAEHAWRGRPDRLRRALELLRLAADRDVQVVLHADEVLAARALAFAGGLCADGDVGAALRRFAARLDLARRVPTEAEPWLRHPLAVVNAVARATGLW